jgi:hypothetical protein
VALEIRRGFTFVFLMIILGVGLHSSEVDIENFK